VQIWVIDTASVIELRRGVPRQVRKHVMVELDKRVNDSTLVYPPEVLGELERVTDEITKKSSSDVPFTWVKRNEVKATRYGHLYDGAREVLKKVPNLIDPEKVSVGGRDDADPHVVALALRLKAEGYDVTIITDDVRPKSKKMSLADAAGVFRIPSVTMRTFLVSEGIWDGQEGT